ncbi:Metallo-dependent phosphatase [Cryphonectria parasitica EP155]|uniref:Metallo-dependent phosphatase n=1 Tax=Cryphonectria parasitica (strain ATCC 38755 / EP155) TaxID=660469 RepID=A0A9P5CLS7_CRYP1|nr:Metallo-dependent phosphatase [Cryphonectria parasitica EP155]KAF3763398.1 Metallo-dependent phosphatase [Cryphonectria parasitica EP155]
MSLLSQRAAATWPALQFTDAGTFQITIFEDLHFGEAEDTDWGPLQDVDTLEVMQTVLDNETPQLVILNGDLITGENTFKENSTDYVDEIVAPLVEAGLPWASTYGNHDSDFNLSRTEIYDREKTYANSLTGNMVQANDSGISNYYLPVYADNDTSVTPAMILWFFDSRGGNYYQELAADGTSVSQPNWVGSSVVSWFEETRAQLTTLYGTSLPSLAFVHIPVDAFLAFQDAGVDATQEPGINADVPLSQQGVQSGEGSSETVYTYDGQDVPFMQALLETENLIAVFSGHDHGNDWCFQWDEDLAVMGLTGNGLDLCFSRHTGYGGYGSWTRGSRQILVSLETLGNATETWTRLEDGSVVGDVMLNSTFGSDEYPAVPLTYTSEYDEGQPYSR